MTAPENGSTTRSSTTASARAMAEPKSTSGAPLVSIHIAQTPSVEKPEKSAVGDVVDSASAVAGALAALFALLSLRQVQRLAHATQRRDARLATLNLLRAGTESLGHKSMPLRNAVTSRAEILATWLLDNGASGARSYIEAAIVKGRILDIIIAKNVAVLIKMADWYGPISSKSKDDIGAFLNMLEETCTSILRATLDFRTLDKMYGSLIRECYCEASQAIYYHRRTGTYRYFDQFEHVLDRLNAAHFQLFRRPRLPLKLWWLLFPSNRRLVRELDHYAPQTYIDGAQLELALINSNLIDEEEEIRHRLAINPNRYCFKKVRKAFFATWRNLPTDTRRFELKQRKALIIEISDIDAASAVVELAGVKVKLGGILNNLPSGFFDQEHLCTRTDRGAFAGPRRIYVCRIVGGNTCRGDDLRQQIRILKRELNTGRLRPFILLFEDAEPNIRECQAVIYSEGGVLLHVQNAPHKMGIMWLF